MGNRIYSRTWWNLFKRFLLLWFSYFMAVLYIVFLEFIINSLFDRSFVNLFWDRLLNFLFCDTVVKFCRMKFLDFCCRLL